jgi:hypothetical protein
MMQYDSLGWSTSQKKIPYRKLKEMLKKAKESYARGDDLIKKMKQIQVIESEIAQRDMEEQLGISDNFKSNN